jgi:hypothetical protein
MTSETSRASLELNGRHHHYDADLERACELWDSGDRAAFDALPQQLRSQADIYRDLRQSHRDAVEAGVITDDGPSAA